MPKTAARAATPAQPTSAATPALAARATRTTRCASSGSTRRLCCSRRAERCFSRSAARYLLLVRIDGKDTASVVGALIHKVKQLPRGLLLSLTWDRGTELAMHKVFSRETGVRVYFCDPRSPWQRGTRIRTKSVRRPWPRARLRSESLRP